MPSLVLKNEIDEKARLGGGRLLRESLVATEDSALLFAVSGKQLNQITDIRTSAGASQPFSRPVECVLHEPIIADPTLERRGQKAPVSFGRCPSVRVDSTSRQPRGLRVKWISNTLRSMSEDSTVYLLWHGDDLEEGTPEAKLLGVYSSEQKAQERLTRSLGKPGFADHPDDFLIVPQTVDKDDWPDGYVEVG